MADYAGTSGNDVADHSSDIAPKSWDYSQGGSDRLYGGGGHDTFFMGNKFWSPPVFTTNKLTLVSPDDVIDGGLGGDALELAGNYYQTASRSPSALLLVIGPSAIQNISTLKLDEGAGFGYRLKLLDGVLTYGTVDASTLTSALLSIDASASTGSLRYVTGTGTYDIKGGSGFDEFDLRNGFEEGSRVNGGVDDTTNFVRLTTIRHGATLNLPDAGFANINSFGLYGDLAYTVTAGDVQTAAGRETSVTINSPGGTLQFDGSAETDGRLHVVGGRGRDTLIGGHGDDFLHGGDLPAGDTIDGGDGDDQLWVAIATGMVPHVNGGAGVDRLSLELAPDDPTIVITSGAMRDLEYLQLVYGPGADGKFDPTRHYSAAWMDGNLVPGQVLAVAVNATGVRFNFDAGAEAHGAFTFYLPGVGLDGFAGGDRWVGGDGDDLFFARDPYANAGSSNIWLGGGGADTLDYHEVRAAMTIDAAAGVALGSGSVGDRFSGFESYVFGSGDNLFNGAETGERVDLLSAGRDTVYGNGGDDLVRLGATLDRSDVIDGGSGADTVVLDGDYSTGLALGPSTLNAVERLLLTSGHSYAFTADAATAPAGARLTVDGAGLGPAEALAFDGAAVGGRLVLRGGAGGDTLIGGAAADTLTGGRGHDVLTGAGGADRFVFAARDTSPRAATADSITDFSHADGDRIDLSAIDADTTQSGVQTFTFIRREAFSSHAGELRYSFDHNTTVVTADTDGDGKANLAITLTGRVGLVDADFVLPVASPASAHFVIEPQHTFAWTRSYEPSHVCLV